MDPSQGAVFWVVVVAKLSGWVALVEKLQGKVRGVEAVDSRGCFGCWRDVEELEGSGSKGEYWAVAWQGAIRWARADRRSSAINMNFVALQRLRADRAELCLRACYC